MKQVTDVVPKFDDYNNIPLVVLFSCRVCYRSSRYNGAKPSLVGWCETPESLQTILECPHCNHLYRMAIVNGTNLETFNKILVFNLSRYYANEHEIRQSMNSEL